MKALVVGNFVRGFTVYGPFNNETSAMEYRKKFAHGEVRLADMIAGGEPVDIAPKEYGDYNFTNAGSDVTNAPIGNDHRAAEVETPGAEGRYGGGASDGSVPDGSGSLPGTDSSSDRDQ